MPTNRNLNNQTIVKKQNYIDINNEDVKVSVEYDISVSNGRT